MHTKNEDTLGGMMPVGRGMFTAETRVPSGAAKAKARRHERRKVREVLHQMLIEDDGLR